VRTSDVAARAGGAADLRERARLETLRAMHLLDQPVAEGINEIVRLAAEVCDVPFAAMNVIDADWQTSLATFGATLAPAPRADAMCNQVITGGRAIVTPDASQEQRFATNPFVVGPIADVRFYASVPLQTDDGHVLGTLCTYDTVRHDITETQVKLLKALAGQLIGIVQLRRSVVQATEAATRLAEQADRAAEVLESSSDAYLRLDSGGVVTDWNDAARRTFGWTRAEAVGRTPADLFMVGDDEALYRAMVDSTPSSSAGTGRRHRPRPRPVPLPAYDRDGNPLTVEVNSWRAAGDAGWHAFLRDVTELEAARREREAAEERWRATFENAPIGMVVNDVTDPAAPRLISANRTFCVMLWMSEERLREAGTPAITHPDDRDRDGRHFQDMLSGVRPTFSGEKRYLRADGATVWARVSGALVRLGDGSMFLISQVEDITEARAAESARRRAEDMLEIAFNHAVNGIAVLSARDGDHGRLLRANPALVAMTGRDDLVGGPLASLLDAGTDPAGAGDLLAGFDRLAAGEEEEYQRVCRLRAGGGHISADVFLALSRDDQGRPEHVMAQLRDVTRQQAHEEMLTKSATTDPLTGLANRLLMRDRLDYEIDALRTGEGLLAVMLLDLDRFKSVNDTLGHTVGDDLLRLIATAVAGVVPPDAMVARLGGDEFLVIASGLHRPEIDELAARIADAVARVSDRLFADEPGVDVTASVGTASTSNPGTAPEDLIRAADQAMYDTKRGRRRIHVSV
jgi:diguanylate cyclase (GGDEF)-like protein/PAS domain S-box-containing protein